MAFSLSVVCFRLCSATLSSGVDKPACKCATAQCPRYKEPDAQVPRGPRSGHNVCEHMKQTSAADPTTASSSRAASPARRDLHVAHALGGHSFSGEEFLCETHHIARKMLSGCGARIWCRQLVVRVEVPWRETLKILSLFKYLLDMRHFSSKRPRDRFVLDIS